LNSGTERFPVGNNRSSPRFSQVCLSFLWKKQYEIHSKLPLRVGQRLGMNGVVEVLNLKIHRLMTHLENAADTTSKRYDPSFIRRQPPNSP
jgi:hypothetical protein